jgi:hypothetical protein
MGRARHRALLALALFIFLVSPAFADRRMWTVVHSDPTIYAGEKSKLDLEVMDSFGDPVPWGDLMLHHERKIHIYAVHQVRVPAYMHSQYLSTTCLHALRNVRKVRNRPS